MYFCPPKKGHLYRGQKNNRKIDKRVLVLATRNQGGRRNYEGNCSGLFSTRLPDEIARRAGVVVKDVAAS
jgi:hypothetical protein